MADVYLLLITELDAWDRPFNDVGVFSEESPTLPPRCMVSVIMRCTANNFSRALDRVIEAVTVGIALAPKPNIWTWVREQLEARDPTMFSRVRHFGPT